MNKKADKPQELIFGIHPIVEVLKAKKRSLVRIYTTKPTPKSWQEIERLLPKHIPISYMQRDALTRLAGTADHQGVIAFAHPFVMRKTFFDAKKHPFLVMLDAVQDTRNVGAILRSAYCTNVSGIIICKKSSAPINASTLKASAGLAEHLEIYEAPSAVHAIQELKKAGYAIYLAALGGKNITDVTFKEPLCIVIGNEATGISPAIASSGERVMLPQKTADISYNASVAAGILLFWVAIAHKRLP